MKQKMNYDLRFRGSGKPKMNCDFASRSLRKAKMNYDFASRSLRNPKMNCDFASRSVRRRKNELRFCFPECPETQKRIAISLPGVPGNAKTNCSWASRSTRRRKKESQLGFAERRGNAKGIAIPMQCASCIREISYGKASSIDREGQKEFRFLCSVSSMFERRVAVWLHGTAEVAERVCCGASWRGGGKKRERGEACVGVG